MRLPQHADVRRRGSAHRQGVRGLSRGAALLAALLAGGAVAADSTDINLGACLKAAGYADALLTRTSSGAWIAIATLDSFGVKVLVDPRAPYTFLDATTLKKLGYGLIPGKRDVTFEGTREPLYRVPLANFALGSLNADSQWFDVTRIVAVVQAAGLDETVAVAGIIGGDMLRRCDALFDMEHDRLFLREPRPAPVDTVVAKPKKVRGKAGENDTLFGELEKRLRRRESTKGGSDGKGKTAEEQAPQGGAEAEAQE